MQKITKEFLVVFLIFLFTSACGSTFVSKSNATNRDVESIPIESVDAETNGKRFGDTHFSLSFGELFLSYEYFNSNEIANSKYLEKKSADKQILKTEDVLDKNEKKVGEKSLAASKGNKKKFCLIWTKNNKLTEVCAESLEALTEFEQTYKI